MIIKSLLDMNWGAVGIFILAMFIFAITGIVLCVLQRAYGSKPKATSFIDESIENDIDKSVVVPSITIKQNVFEANPNKQGTTASNEMLTNEEFIQKSDVDLSNSTAGSDMVTDTELPKRENIVEDSKTTYTQLSDIIVMSMSGTSKETASPTYDILPDKNGKEEIINCTVTAVAKKLSTLKDLREFKNFVVIDFETTGFSSTSDKAIEVACLKIVNGESSEYQTLINPQVHISSSITKINGITDKMVLDCPTIVPVAKQLYDFCDNLPFVAHNASFDMKFLKQAYIEANIETTLLYVDTLSLSRTAFPEYDTHKLEFLIKELCLAEKQTHRAMDDVHCTKKLLDLCITKIIEQKQKSKKKK